MTTTKLVEQSWGSFGDTNVATGRYKELQNRAGSVLRKDWIWTIDPMVHKYGRLPLTHTRHPHPQSLNLNVNLDLVFSFVVNQSAETKNRATFILSGIYESPQISTGHNRASDTCVTNERTNEKKMKKKESSTSRNRRSISSF